MRSRTVRRSATAGSIYLSAVLGFLGQILAARELGVKEYGLLAIVMAVTGFVQLLFDLTVEEAVIKYGFRYQASEQWGKLRRLYTRALRIKLLGSRIAGAAIADRLMKLTISARSAPSGSCGACGKPRKTLSPATEIRTVVTACATTSSSTVSVMPWREPTASATKRVPMLTARKYERMS